MKILTAVFAALVVFALTASASPVGVLTIGQCADTGVTVTATTIDWLPAGTGSGCIVSSPPTSVTYSTGTLVPNETGSIKDLTLNGGAVSSFMTFAASSGLVFNLTSVGPGVSTDCSTVTSFTTNQQCSIIAGGQISPFVLSTQAGGTGTTVTLAARGTVTDSSGSSLWSGPFTTQFAGVTPAQIEAAILTGTTVGIPGTTSTYCSGGSCTNSYSGSFTITITAVPEPVSFLLIGGGLVALVGITKRYKRAEVAVQGCRWLLRQE
jgi:hypothetical protein